MKSYLIGIDGGGSKTEFMLCDLGLNEVARHLAGRSNPNDTGIDACADMLTAGVKTLCEKADVKTENIAAAFAGIAGITADDYIIPIEQALKKALPNAAVAALHDGTNVLYGAFPDSDGVSVICGTGSSCFVKKSGEVIRIGGYGTLDLCGNGYEIGRAALAHALKTVDGREKEGMLEEILHERFGADFLDALNRMLALSKNETAALAREAVFPAAERGDKAALAIIDANMEYIASLIKRAGDYFEGGYGVALAGGIFNDTLACETLKAKIPARAKLVKLDRSPAFGAAARAKQLLT